MDQCTYHKCKRNLPARKEAGEELDREEKNHVLRFHTDTPVEFKCRDSGKLLSFSRHPALDMKFRCTGCSKSILPRSSVKVHYDMCPVREKQRLLAWEAKEDAELRSAVLQPSNKRPRPIDEQTPNQRTQPFTQPSRPVAPPATTTTPLTGMSLAVLQLQYTVKKHEETIQSLVKHLRSQHHQLENLERRLAEAEENKQ
ncbi:hypothetical protein BGZ99_006743 [Dissophora globulifera]|uniref:Uncharacterized protein n=1 Tax=Dissophora globulifera TaxID=979702 RepID=A0A9P6URZ6_9FUNG|nr:hypothetical protein BGZ99_006743 [Dissophora globulifera]